MKNFWKSGDPFIWLTGGALAVALIMVVGLLGLILISGMGFFWPRNVIQLTLADGKIVIGQLMEREAIPQPGAPPRTPVQYRIKIKQGNRDLYGVDFIWIDEAQIVRREMPSEAVVVERREWGNLYGFIEAVKEGNRVVAQGSEAGWDALQALLPGVRTTVEEIRRIEQKEIGGINYSQEQIRLDLRKLDIQGVTTGPEVERLRQDMSIWQGQYDAQQRGLTALRQSLTASVVIAVAGNLEKDLLLADIARIYRPNLMSVPSKLWFYATKVWEFIADDPRESNTEGGVFPAIFGTVMMVMIMSVVVTPLGVLAALYLREYAKQGTFVSTVRIAVNNLAGVPSIVFGVFGVGFFIYFVGGSIDQLFFPAALPTPTFGTGGIFWASLTLALLTVPVVIVATEEGLAAIPGGVREASYALGATKFETTLRVVIPSVMPSILTGLILAMARAAGEVAPLMLTGVVKLAPALPIDGFWPFLHLERKFMHLGFHIYDVGFQSPNIEAARPMVYTTATLLLLIVVILNLAAITLRNRLRKKYATSAV
jgi:phosphate transport system permease protein